MYPVSPQFLREISRGPTLITYADVYKAGMLILGDIPIVSGSIMEDSTALYRRRCELTLSPGEDNLRYVPGKNAAEDYGLWPTGSMIHVYQGIRYRDVDLGQEIIPMGIFRISAPKVSDGGEGPVVSLQGFDLSRSISRSRFKDAYQIVRGTPVTDAIRAIILYQCPWLGEEDFDFGEVGALGAYTQSISLESPQLVFDRTDDPWKQCVDLAAASGLDLTISRESKISLRVEPNPQWDETMYDYVDGEDCTLTTITRDINDEEAYNGVVCTGENSSNPTVARAEVWDIDPMSPTYYDPLVPQNSSYGANPYFLSSQYISSNEQAAVAAQAKFNSLGGLIENISITAFPPNFAHDAKDVVRVTHDAVNVDTPAIIESLRIGLGEEGSFEATMRARYTGGIY
jgi:hypothetical protein